MKAFADLYLRLDATTSSNAKVAAMRDYFSAAAPADAAWAAYFLAGGKPRQIVPVKVLRQLTREAAALPEWLFDECYHAVGDLAETIALLLPHYAYGAERGLSRWLEEDLLPLRGLAPADLAARLLPLLQQLDQAGKLVAIKLITGAFRVGVSKLLLTRALAELTGLAAADIAQRFVGYTDIGSMPDAARYLRLIGTGAMRDEQDGRPYPFFLAHPLPTAAEGGTVIDGEIVVWSDERVRPFALLQQRIGRKKLSAAILDSAPAAVLAYDLLEWQGEDWRSKPQVDRRTALEVCVERSAQPRLRLSPLLRAATWEELAAQRNESRARGVEGLMLKEKDSLYGIGRTRNVGIWWKWKIDPYAVDAVLVYAERGHGRRASLYTDYTFAVWDSPPENPARTLVPFAKAYSGLTDDEIREVDAIVRRTTVEQFGPVRRVEPQLVFELAFEGIARSRRHKSGIAVRFPRMLRWRRDKPVPEADTLRVLEALLAD